MRFISLVLIWTFSMMHFSAFSQSKMQQDWFQKKTILLKVKPEYSKKFKEDPLSSPILNSILKHSEYTKFYALFPNHSKPLEAINSWGDSLVDISLWYQLEYHANIPESKLISDLKSTQLFIFVEQRAKNHLLYMPDDSLITQQYYPRKVHAFEAWDIEQGDSNVIIGIVDTGTDIFGEDLKDGIALNLLDTIDGIDNDNDGYIDNYRGWDLAMGDNNPQSYFDHHGCFTTGIAAATVNNHRGIAGLGFKTKYLPVRISNDDGFLNKDYEGIVYAADHGATIINNSWGGFGKTHFGQDIVNYAHNNRNCLVVAACGNSNSDWWLYPASYDNVMSVAGTDSLDVRYDQSSFGTTVDIAAPGAKVLSTWTSNGYFASSGTSFAAPGVAAAAALLKSKYPNLNPLQLEEQLRISADPIDTITANLPFANLLGSGRLNMYKALIDTLKPGIRLRQKSIICKNFAPTDTIFLSGNFTNMLHASSPSLKAHISSISPYLSIVNPIVNLGALSTMAHYSNTTNPILIKIAPNAPFETKASIKITYIDTNYSAYEYVNFNINPNYAVLDTNNIECMINSHGNIAYTNEERAIGEGLRYKNSKSLLYWGGLVVGNSTGKVSANIYGENGVDEEFSSIIPAQAILNPNWGDQEIHTVFNDQAANFNALNIEISHRAYAFHQQAEDIIFLKYNIHNQGSSALNSLYISFYADWDIGLSYQNKAHYDPSLQMAYTENPGGNYCGGVLVLDSLPVNVYNLDNDGSANSINIYDGFLDYEKYLAQQGGRTNAGFANTVGGDVSNLIGVGPLQLAAGDSVEVNFAILAHNHLNGLKQAAQEARDIFYFVDGFENNANALTASVSPNPFQNTLDFSFKTEKQGPFVVQIYNVHGKLVLQKEFANTQVKSLKLNTTHLPKGLYFYKLESNTQTWQGKIMKL